MDFKKALQDEIYGLEASLKASPDPRLVKLHELRRVLAIYNGEAPATAPEQTPRFAGVADAIRKPRGRQADPMRQAALDASREILSLVQSPLRTSAIYEKLTERGIRLAGHFPVNNLSAMLYHQPEFVSHGRAGWTLKSSGGEPSENEKPADHVSSGEQSAGLSQPSAQGGEPDREVEHDNMS
ncbi:winged helix-turn-helix domain-containing protein [Mesorhizobium sp. M0621]|uniref:hypothetical protein n=1 Tax=Mesorhizobium sp. M0621 TaxID=2956974 RepID=UPI00333CB987